MANEKKRELIRFGNNIRRCREEKGVSQEEMAHLCGLDRTHYGGAERGDRNITVMTAVKIAEALEVGLDVLGKGVVGE